jgi:hypothetical protein
VKLFNWKINNFGGCWNWGFEWGDLQGNLREVLVESSFCTKVAFGGSFS